ncbi:hypothetical protein ACJX0J_020746, partial [Zea mays]
NMFSLTCFLTILFLLILSVFNLHIFCHNVISKKKKIAKYIENVQQFLKGRMEYEYLYVSCLPVLVFKRVHVLIDKSLAVIMYDVHNIALSSIFMDVKHYSILSLFSYVEGIQIPSKSTTQNHLHKLLPS